MKAGMGNTRIVQVTAGTPVATQIAYDTGSSNPPEAHVVLQDHSVILVPTEKRRAEGYKPSYWGKPTSVFASINWGDGSGEFAIAQAATMLYGDKDLGDEALTGAAAMRSQMALRLYLLPRQKRRELDARGESVFCLRRLALHAQRLPELQARRDVREQELRLSPSLDQPWRFQVLHPGLAERHANQQRARIFVWQLRREHEPALSRHGNYKSLVMTSTLISAMLALPVPPVRLGFHSRTAPKSISRHHARHELGGCKMHIVNTASTTGEKEISSASRKPTPRGSSREATMTWLQNSATVRQLARRGMEPGWLLRQLLCKCHARPHRIRQFPGFIPHECWVRCQEDGQRRSERKRRENHGKSKPPKVLRPRRKPPRPPPRISKAWLEHQRRRVRGSSGENYHA